MNSKNKPSHKPVKDSIPERLDKKIRFRTFQYSDGSTIKEQYDELYDGPWKYGNNVIEVIFVKDTPNPLYDDKTSK